ncbi:alpha-hydroxy-acid oxidizing protein [Oxalobacteraceae bacterium CAVE-383]|nr:alpha-hydroxy-acid oxidizing protein [Oxalobacteraceae bacterium CAVE-383]
MSRLDRCYNIADLREAARRRLPQGVFQYVDKGTEDQLAVDNNRRALDSAKLLHRVLTDVSDVRTETEIFGRPAAMPLIIAPTGVAGMCWYQGELELAKAAAKAGVPFTLATGSNTSMEKVAEQAGGQLWFQLYMWREKALSYELIKRAARAGFDTLIWTVDIPHKPNREHDQRNGFSMPYKLNARSVIDALRHPEWLATVLGRYMAGPGMPRHVNFPDKYQHKFTGKATAAKALQADRLGWEDVDRLREIWPGKLIVKGVMRVDDARQAVARGVDGIVVSNHGGRSMDSAPSTLEVLPGIAAAVGDRTTVLVDSGIRRGSDIVKCLALGAKGVLTGRATLYGVGAGGEAGAAKALAILKAEMRRTMAYVGCQRVEQLSDDVIWRGRTE